MVRDKGVARVFALENHCQMQSLREFDRYVLHGVHGDVGIAAQHTLLEFFDKQAFAADLRERRVQDLIALGTHPQYVDLKVGMSLPQRRSDVFGLPHGERRFAGGDADAVLGHGDAEMTLLD